MKGSQKSYSALLGTPACYLLQGHWCPLPAVAQETAVAFFYRSAAKRRSAPFITNKRAPHLMQIQPQKQELTILASCFSSCKGKQYNWRKQDTLAQNGNQQNKQFESGNIRYSCYYYMLSFLNSWFGHITTFPRHMRGNWCVNDVHVV